MGLLNQRSASKEGKIICARRKLSRDRIKRSRGLSLLDSTPRKQRKLEPPRSIPSVASAFSVTPDKHGGCYDSDANKPTGHFKTPEDEKDDLSDTDPNKDGGCFDSDADKPIGPFKTPEDEKDDLSDTDDER